MTKHSLLYGKVRQTPRRQCNSVQENRSLYWILEIRGIDHLDREREKHGKDNKIFRTRIINSMHIPW